MSDAIKLNFKSKKIKAFIPDYNNNSESYTELPHIVEKEKIEQAHKHEMEEEYKKGYEDAEKNVTEELEQKHSDELLNQSKDFYSIVSTFEEKFKIFENDFHSLVIKVSQRIAEKILQKELADNTIIEKLLDQNLRNIIGANDIIIKLNPTDYKLIQKSNKQYLASSGGSKIRFESNENIQIGGCLIESEIGNLDAKVESQLNEIVKDLENSFTKIESE
jgi:flagellar assembly protein FliH